VAWRLGLVRHEGGLGLDPAADWFEERFVKPGEHEAEDAELVLSRREQEEARDRRLVAKGKGSPWATWILVGLNAAAFLTQVRFAWALARFLSPQQALAQFLLGGEIWGAGLEALGGNSSALTFGQGQFWRLGASLFLHAGLAHLAFNMVSLVVLGGLMERFSGPWRLALIYAASGLAASLASALLNDGVVSVGASGAIFGLAGALMALRFRAPEDFPPSLAGRIYSSLARPVAYTFLIGILLAFWNTPMRFDNWAHFGGLFMGFSLVRLWPELLRKTKR
jgi:rhomboid protease GluP